MHLIVVSVKMVGLGRRPTMLFCAVAGGWLVAVMHLNVVSFDIVGL